MYRDVSFLHLSIPPPTSRVVVVTQATSNIPETPKNTQTSRLHTRRQTKANPLHLIPIQRENSTILPSSWQLCEKQFRQKTQEFGDFPQKNDELTYHDIARHTLPHF